MRRPSFVPVPSLCPPPPFPLGRPFHTLVQLESGVRAGNAGDLGAAGQRRDLVPLVVRVGREGRGGPVPSFRIH